MDFTVEYFETENGEKPVEDFIKLQDVKTRTKIYKELEILIKNGYKAREPYSAPLEDGIFELRTKLGNNISRILYFFVIGRKIILTNGFIKKQQKTPRGEINLAKKRRTEYLKREASKNG